MEVSSSHWRVLASSRQSLPFYKKMNLWPRCGDARGGSDTVFPRGQRTRKATRCTPCLQTGEALCHLREDIAMFEGDLPLPTGISAKPKAPGTKSPFWPEPLLQCLLAPVPLPLGRGGDKEKSMSRIHSLVWYIHAGCSGTRASWPPLCRCEARAGNLPVGPQTCRSTP